MSLYSSHQKKEADPVQSHYTMGSGSSYTTIGELDNPILALADKIFTNMMDQSTMT